MHNKVLFQKNMLEQDIFHSYPSFIEKPFVPACERPRYSDNDKYVIFSMADFTYDAATKLLDQAEQIVPPTHNASDDQHSPSREFTFTYESGDQMIIEEERGIDLSRTGLHLPFHKISLQQIPNKSHPAGERIVITRYETQEGEEPKGHFILGKISYDVQRIRRSIVHESHAIERIGEKTVEIGLLKRRKGLDLIRNYLYKMTNPDQQPVSITTDIRHATLNGHIRDHITRTVGIDLKNNTPTEVVLVSNQNS
jgi:hypothetical protein